LNLGDRILAKGMAGADVVEVQLRLAGFAGTVWDGTFGPHTESQIVAFQKDFMKIAPTGVVDQGTVDALVKFTQKFPIDFNHLRCPCGACDGFGQGQFPYCETDKPEVEAYCKYEYPGIHKAILHAFRAAWFYSRSTGLGEAIITSGYRCWINNARHSRTTTNHMGKALDWVPSSERFNAVRALMVQKSNFQIGWSIKGMKALEPSDIATSWVHMYVREMGPCYDLHFVKNTEDLDSLTIKS